MELSETKIKLLNEQNEKKEPLLFKNINLTSLKGFPKIINNDFDCYNNELTTLEHSPEIIKGNFDCSNNKLKSLDSQLKEVKGYFYCYNNKLTTLKGRPKYLNGGFICRNNDLTSLKYRPESVDDFDCSYNKLTTLKGRPKKINGVFDCTINPDLKNIKQQIIEYQIQAKYYKTDEGNFYFKDIKKEFEEYKKKLQSLQEITTIKQKLIKLIPDMDYNF